MEKISHVGVAVMPKRIERTATASINPLDGATVIVMQKSARKAMSNTPPKDASRPLEGASVIEAD